MTRKVISFFYDLEENELHSETVFRLENPKTKEDVKKALEHFLLRVWTNENRN